MGFSGVVDGSKVEDRLEHFRWVKHLNENIYVTLELIKRPDYDYLDQIKSNWQMLENIYSTKSI